MESQKVSLKRIIDFGGIIVYMVMALEVML